MTDTSSSIATHSTPQFQPVTASTQAPPPVNGSPSDLNLPDDEDGTIRCICGFAEDDGNTVFCEECKTWQHIECYYPSQLVPEIHFCSDCDSRDLDIKRAKERQRRLRDHPDGGDRKTRRPTSKSHKKKIKDPMEQMNGINGHERHDSISYARDQPPPAKRPKTSHQTSGSVTSFNGNPVLVDSRRRAASNAQGYPSPTKSPQNHLQYPAFPLYSSEFLYLYDNDQGKENLSDDAGNFNTINVTTKLSAWHKNPYLLAEETGRQNIEQVFMHLDRSLDRATWPRVSLEHKINHDVDFDGKCPSWHLLRLETEAQKGDLVGEIAGQISLLDEYCRDPSNRWQELHHPEPFVFFHPHMPICIDSRREGTQFRYLRRSCRPNVTLKTFCTSDGEYHHCFVAMQHLRPGCELTAQWYMDQTLFSNGKVKDEFGVEELRRTTWASRILANFGDCACDKSQQCLWAPLDYRRPPKLTEAPIKQANGRKRKTKARQAISPQSTGHATNSRAGSENVKIQEDEEGAECRSVSGSSRSNPRSRDLTPVNSNGLDVDGVEGLTGREKRKIAMAEAAFQRAEQEQHGQKKKKRTSAGSTLNTPISGPSKSYGAFSRPSTPSVSLQPNYIDVASARLSGSPPPLTSSTASRQLKYFPQKSSAPSTSSLLSPFSRPTYVDSAIQTDIEGLNTTEEPPPTSTRRRFITPTQRLLKRVLDERARIDHRHLSNNDAEPMVFTPQPASPSPEKDAHLDDTTTAVDVEMSDALSRTSSLPSTSAAVVKPTSSAFPHPTEVLVELPPPPLPSQAAHLQKNLHGPKGYRLQLSTLPPVPFFSNTALPVTPASNSSTPNATTPSTAQSPFNFAPGSSNSYPGLSMGAVAPSPVKKKLSLGDYMSRRSILASTPVVEKTEAQALPAASTISSHDTDAKPALPENDAIPTVKLDKLIGGIASAMGDAEDFAVVDTPAKENPATPAMNTSPATDFTTTPVTTPGVISPEIANVLSALNAVVPVQGYQHSRTSSS